MTIPSASLDTSVLRAALRANTKVCRHHISLSYGCRDCRRAGPSAPDGTIRTIAVQERIVVPASAPLARQAGEEGQTNYDHHPAPPVPNPKQRQRPPKLAGGDGREAQGPARPFVCFTLSRVRLLDVDAKWGSVKDLLDGLQYAGLIRSDKEGEITLEVRQEKVSSFKEEETVIEIRNPDGPSVADVQALLRGIDQERL